MTAHTTDGGPAFPVLCQWVDGVPVQGVQTDNAQGWAMGMSLRDYFAAKVIGHLCVSELRQENTMQQDVAYAYAVADAMLKAREVGL